MAKRQPKTPTDDSKPSQPSADEQSGSGGRRTDVPDGAHNRDTGQSRYGQSGAGGKVNRETEGQAQYRESSGGGAKHGSNRGSGRADREIDGVDQPTTPGRSLRRHRR